MLFFLCDEVNGTAPPTYVKHVNSHICVLVVLLHAQPSCGVSISKMVETLHKSQNLLHVFFPAVFLFLFLFVFHSNYSIPVIPLVINLTPSPTCRGIC